jgi:toxin ParE1/3/4
MAKFFLTQKAIDDLSKIWNYTYNKWSEEQADKYYYQILLTCQELAENPEMGKKYEEIDSGILGFKIQKHILFYRNGKKQSIEILRILHVQMDLKNRMKD